MKADRTSEIPLANLSIKVAIPSSESCFRSLHDQLREVTEQIQATAQKNGAHVFQQTIFLQDYADRHTCQAYWQEVYGEQMPVNVYVPQAPCDGQALAVEAILTTMETCTLSGGKTGMSRQDGMKLYFTVQQTPPQEDAPIYEQSVASFQKLEKAFQAEGIPFQNVIRTWLYLGNITEPTYSIAEGETQRYKELNRARTDFFRGISFFKGLMPPRKAAAYPASTGIGGNGDTLTMSALAVQWDAPNAGVIVPLENPQQVSAFDYGEEYSPKSPKFARALLLANQDRGMIFVSGTASITDAESRFDRPDAQTIQTLENIAVLIDESNLENHGQRGFGCTLDGLAVMRVYVKRPQDYAAIREICDHEMPHVPKIYTFADICRPELLVEIEGIAFTARS